MDDQTRLPLKARTLLAQAMGAGDPVTNALVPPIHMSATYLRDADNNYSGGYRFTCPSCDRVRQECTRLGANSEGEAPVIHSAATDEMLSERHDTLRCNRSVSQGCASAPQLWQNRLLFSGLAEAGWRRSADGPLLCLRSLLTGNFTGNFAKSRLPAHQRLQIVAPLLGFRLKFPTQRNRESF